MTDCFQLLGQLSDLYCGLIWLPGSKIIIFLIFTAPTHSSWQRWPFKNHICETKTTSSLGEDCLEILQADYTSEMWKAIIQSFYLFILFVVFKMPSLCTECTYSQIEWQNPSRQCLHRNGSGLWSSTGRAGGVCIFCFFGGWDAPAQAVSPSLHAWERLCSMEGAWNRVRGSRPQNEDKMKHKRVSRTQERRVLIRNCSISISFPSHL